jgi:dihydrofolate synthase/folylpolyglutamate synthase
MPRRNLDEWLRWQESLHAHWIDLGLDRVREVAARLGIVRPAGPVFTVAGTNGKGSTVALLDAFLRAAGLRTGTYTSPHLVRYNERVAVDGLPASDEELIAAFERIERARGDVALTFFEFGTLAAFLVFGARRCEAWVLEVGMGGRLDAVNVIDPDYSLITTVALDHQEYLGTDIEAIAAEKAGILRNGRPGFFGDWPVPAAVRRVAGQIDARLYVLGEQFDFTPSRPRWSWRGERTVLDRLAYPPAGTLAQQRNASLVLAAIEQHDSRWLADAARLDAILASARPPGRFQRIEREHEWILDVAHNPQAAATLREQLQMLPRAPDTTVVLGLLADKNLEEFAVQLREIGTRWVSCAIDDPRARGPGAMAAQLSGLVRGEVIDGGPPANALAVARAATPVGGRIVVCGSFRVVGPALQALGIY